MNAGGGIANAGTMVLLGSGVTENEAGRGGGIHNAGHMTIVGKSLVAEHRRYLSRGRRRGHLQPWGTHDQAICGRAELDRQWARICRRGRDHERRDARDLRLDREPQSCRREQRRLRRWHRQRVRVRGSPRLAREAWTSSPRPSSETTRAASSHALTAIGARGSARRSARASSLATSIDHQFPGRHPPGRLQGSGAFSSGGHNLVGIGTERCHGFIDGVGHDHVGTPEEPFFHASVRSQITAA